MSKIFSDLIQQSRYISRDRFARDFGGIPDEVVEMVDSEAARRLVETARKYMEGSGSLQNGRPRLRRMGFGDFTSAPELLAGQVAAVDGTNALPLQSYSAGQALCVGVGSLSHRRKLADSVHYWSSKTNLEEASDEQEFVRRHTEGLFGISQTAYLRYFEVKHAMEIEEPFVLLDGTLVYEWLITTDEGVNLYQELFASGKKCIGILKSLRDNSTFPFFGRALKRGEVFLIETVFDHVNESSASNRNRGEDARKKHILPLFKEILRGVFRPAGKVFGFEVHIDHLDDMLRIIAADAQMNKAGHEIPYLLNRVDEEIRHQFSQRMLMDRIYSEMAERREEMFFEESDERDFR